MPRQYAPWVAWPTILPDNEPVIEQLWW